MAEVNIAPIERKPLVQQLHRLRRNFNCAGHTFPCVWLTSKHPSMLFLNGTLRRAGAAIIRPERCRAIADIERKTGVVIRRMWPMGGADVGDEPGGEIKTAVGFAAAGAAFPTD